MTVGPTCMLHCLCQYGWSADHVSASRLQLQFGHLPRCSGRFYEESHQVLLLNRQHLAERNLTLEIWLKYSCLSSSILANVMCTESSTHLEWPVDSLYSIHSVSIWLLPWLGFLSFLIYDWETTWKWVKESNGWLMDDPRSSKICPSIRSLSISLIMQIETRRCCWRVVKCGLSSDACACPELGCSN